jgi:hypothetical protein
VARYTNRAFLGCSDMSHEEPLSLRTTVIAGIRYADDYAVVWRGLSIGWIMKAIGAASDRQQ